MRDEGLTKGTSFAESMQKLEPRREELLLWLYTEIVRRCRDRGLVPMAAYLPTTRKVDDPKKLADMQRQMEMAREAGFVVLDLTAAYDGVEDFPSIWIAPWDSHPNAEGHRMLAEELYAQLIASNVLVSGNH
jgi:hypothetical protein